MSIQYNRELVQFFKDQGYAISNLEDFEPGNIYYMNPNKTIRLIRIFSDREYHMMRNTTPYIKPFWIKDGDAPMWFEYQTFYEDAWDNRYSVASLYDNNIGESYNPWMIFKNVEYCKAYNMLQEITRKHDEYDDFTYN